MRLQAVRNFLATLAFSQGVPMLSHGDELGRTQHGNNNAYCQDNEISWVDWNLSEEQKELFAFAKKVFEIRQINPVLRRRHFFRGVPITEGGPKDLTWIRPDGGEMTERDWHDPSNHAIGMLIHGDATDETDAHGEPITGATLLILVNGGERQACFFLPERRDDDAWSSIIDTAQREGPVVENGCVAVDGYSLVLLHYRGSGAAEEANGRREQEARS
jgi:glycogen operon protein